MTNSPNPDRVDTIIVGGGQAGLATAHYLKLAGVDCLVLDSHHRIGDQWRDRWDSLMLNTPRHRNSLPGLRFPDGSAFASAAELADYLEDYASKLGIAVRTGVTVTGIERVGSDVWRVTCSEGSYLAPNVVVATGGERNPRIPEFAEQLDPGIRQLHSSAYRNPGQLLPGPVLVVGAGQSGADLAVECARSGHATLLSGRIKAEVPFAIESVMSRITFPLLWFLANHVLTERTPIGRKVKPAVRSGNTAPLVRVRSVDLDRAGVRRVEARTVGVSEGRPLLADGQILEVSNVLWCTGFGQDFGIIRPPVTDEHGWPTDTGGIMTGLPGLYFMGLLFQRGFYSMLIGGVARDAKYIAEHIAARSRAAQGRIPAAHRVG
jgi:putative flavoprotein involved in K+ transport